MATARRSVQGGEAAAAAGPQPGTQSPPSCQEQDTVAAAGSAASVSQAKTHVLLYVPNLVGYARAGLLLAAAAVERSRPQLCLWLFALNFLLDGVDGTLARRLGQVRRGSWGGGWV